MLYQQGCCTATEATKSNESLRNTRTILLGGIIAVNDLFPVFFLKKQIDLFEVTARLELVLAPHCATEGEAIALQLVAEAGTEPTPARSKPAFFSDVPRSRVV